MFCRQLNHHACHPPSRYESQKRARLRGFSLLENPKETRRSDSLARANAIRPTCWVILLEQAGQIVPTGPTIRFRFK